MGVENADFSGYATKADLKCSDGRTISDGAFKHQDGQQVPLVWSHRHDDPDNVLGHAILEYRDNTHPEGAGVYTYGFFNDNAKSVSSKKLVQHKDVTWLSIYANQLIEQSKLVLHGAIREVSLVLAGANPGAKIDFVNLAHGNEELDPEFFDDTAVIYTGLPIQHSAESAEEIEEEGDETVEHVDKDGDLQPLDIYDQMNEQQKEVVHYMVGKAIEASGESTAEHSGTEQTEVTTDETNNEGDLTHQEGSTEMTHRVFEHNDGTASATGDATKGERRYLNHSEIEEIKDNWKRGGSMRHAVQQFALAHGIENLDLLFPDPKLLETPEFDKRRTEWVDGVINGCRRSPMSRIKTMFADITHEKARALGYIKGNLKKEEFFGLTKRTTAPTTIYKKQKLDRDDVLDATELDIVAFMKREMQLMLKEEIARAILVGDGRPVEDPENPGEPNPDKIKDPAGAVDGVGVRSILNDDELYAATVTVEIDDETASWAPVVEDIMLGMEYYKGSGSPTFYTTLRQMNRMLLSKDGFQRRLWRSKEELATEMGVDRIVPVEVLEDHPELVGIVVNLSDYNVGTDRGGEVTMFDDFDIDYNQLKYLIETRFSGALVKIRSALKIKRAAAGAVEVVPDEPTFNEATGVVTIPAETGVVYKNAETDATLVAGAQAALPAGDSLYVTAVPASGYYFPDDQNDEWVFTREA